MTLHGDFVEIVNKDSQEIKISFDYAVSDLIDQYKREMLEKRKKIDSDTLAEFILNRFNVQYDQSTLHIEGLDNGDIKEHLTLETAEIDSDNDCIIFTAIYDKSDFWDNEEETDEDDDNEKLEKGLYICCVCNSSILNSNELMAIVQLAKYDNVVSVADDAEPIKYIHLQCVNKIKGR